MTCGVSAIQRFSTEDGPGIRTTVFLQGCNLHCPWCHNPETISRCPVLMYYEQKCIGCGLCAKACPRGCHSVGDGHVFDRTDCVLCGACAKNCIVGALEMQGGEMTADAVMEKVLADTEFYIRSNGGVTLSGGEPLIHPGFCREIAMRCKENGLHVLVDTAACVPFGNIETVLEYVDTFYVDFKMPTEEGYREVCGGSLELVMQNARKLVEMGKDVRARVPVIPGMNADKDSLEAIADAIRRCGILHADWLPFHRLGSPKYTAMGMKYSFMDQEPLSKEYLRQITPEL